MKYGYTSWMNVRNILSKERQPQKVTYCVILFI